MEINNISLVRQRANKLYKKYSLSVPVNLDTIIREKNIVVSYEENQLGIDGMCQLQKSPPEIILNTETTYEPRRRFTLAHEIGHICIPWHTGVDLCSLDDPYVRIDGQRMINTQELEANIFASELLMPTDWLKETFQLNTTNLSALVSQICEAANTSIMACFFALENVLPAGDLFFVKKESDDFWKPFRSVNTNCFYISVTNAIPFYDKICNWKTSFRLSWYNVIHYKITPAPNFATLNDVYRACQANMEDFLFAISGGNPITIIPYIDQIVDALDDKYYVIVKIGDIFQRHFRHKDTAIRLHEYHEDIDELYDYVEQSFRCYGKIDFTTDSCIVWIKEYWRGSNVTNTEIDPNLLLKNIVAELYWEDDSLHMLQSINGSIASINSTHKTASQEELYHLARLRFETDPKYEDFVAHRAFEKYISSKTASLIAKRNERRRK